jgi:hypothetical protein
MLLTVLLLASRGTESSVWLPLGALCWNFSMTVATRFVAIRTINIYALVGLARDCRNQVVINYSKSLGQIYKDVMSLYSVTKFND